MSNFNKAMEFFWLFLAIASGVLAGYLIYTEGWDQGKIYLVFPAISGFAFGIRRAMRLRFQKTQEEKSK